MTARSKGWITVDGRKARRRSQHLWPFPPGFYLPEGVSFHRLPNHAESYWGSWAVKDGRLYLTDCGGTVRDELRPAHRSFNLIDLTGSEEPLFAEWITTSIQVSIGEPVDYDHMFEGNIYLTYDDLRIENGIVIKRSIIAWSALRAREGDPNADRTLLGTIP